MSQSNENETGNASFGFVALADGCDNCGIIEENGIQYRPKTKEHKTLDLCDRCTRGFVLCVYNAGLLD